MRPWVLLVLGVGCSQADPVAVSHRGKVDVQSRGVGLSRDGVVAQIGMWGTTCDVRTRSGMLGADHDFPGTEETVVDGGDDPSLGFATVTVSEAGVHLTFPDDGTTVDVMGPSAIDGRLVPGGVVLRLDRPSGCEVAWVPHGSWGPDAVVAVPDEACDPDTSVSPDRDEGELFVVTDDGVLVVDGSGWSLIPVVADLVAWDPWAGALYAARRGGEVVAAYEKDGALRWEAPVRGRVRALDHLGEHAAASVMLELPGGLGALVVLDGATGGERLDLDTPSAASDLVPSDDGSVLGLVLADEVHFYDVFPGR